MDKKFNFSNTRPAINFMVDNLLSSIGNHSALRETEKDLSDDRWFWIDDNAKALEVFVMPGIYEEYKEIADSIADFILDMSEDGLLLRRKSVNKLVVANDKFESFKAYNGIMNHYGNLNSAKILQGYRFHDGRDVGAISFDGFSVAVRYNGEQLSFDVKSDLFQISLEKRSEEVLVQYASLLRTKDGTDIANVKYIYKILAHSVLSEVSLSFECLVTGEFRDLQIKIVKGFKETINYSKICYKFLDKEVLCQSGDSKPGEFSGSDLKWFSVIQEGRMGFSYGLHSIINSHLLKNVNLLLNKNSIEQIETNYYTNILNSSQIFQVAERSLLTAGGLYKTMPYTEIFDNIGSKQELIDYSISYDYGAELNSMSSLALFLGKKLYDISDEKQMLERSYQINSWCLKHLDIYIDNFVYADSNHHIDDSYSEIFLRGHSFVLISAIKLALLNKEQSNAFLVLTAKVDLLLHVLLDNQILDKDNVNYGAFPCSRNDGEIYLDCHGAAILSLTHVLSSYEHIPFNVSKLYILNRIELGFNSIRQDISITVKDEPSSLMEVAFTISDSTQKDGMLWNFKSGLLLRAINSFEEFLHSNIAQNLTVSDSVIKKTMLLEQITYSILDQSKKTYLEKDYVEFLTSFRSEETNSETQPWAMLGYYKVYQSLYSEILSNTADVRYHASELSEVNDEGIVLHGVHEEDHHSSSVLLFTAGAICSFTLAAFTYIQYTGSDSTYEII